ncbi:MAG TPA: DMT family transporter [Spirochaetota bacterium]|nr:DMT family transporter [Spirochaetota bacterium]HOK93425.1 DMT family transporter [Spirochaetota bacterium]HPP94688.1 DMT family transporter [Spirochaetota bacterium]
MSEKLIKSIAGTALILLSALCYAWMPVIAKVTYSTGLAPFEVLILRFIFSLLLLALLLSIKGIMFFKFSPLLLLQGLAFTAGGICFFYSLTYIKAALAIVIFFSHPAIISVMSIIFLKRKPSMVLLFSVFISFLGIIFISGASKIEVNNITGISLAALSAFSYSIYCIISERTLKSYNSLSVAFTMSLVGLIVISLFFYNQLNFLTSLSLKQVELVFLMSLFSTVLAILLFLEGVKRIGSLRASVVGTAEPVFVVLIAFVVLGEKLSFPEIAGSLLVLSGVLISSFHGFFKREDLL